MAHSIGSKPLLLKAFNWHEILNYSAKFSSATGNRSVAANISEGLKLFDDKFVSKISFTEPDFLMNDDFFIQGFVKAEMKKKVTLNRRFLSGVWTVNSPQSHIVRVYDAGHGKSGVFHSAEWHDGDWSSDGIRVAWLWFFIWVESF
ncbi:hypothetical protein TNCV_3946001 [Trichonephila clavipes]|nr:hypothetical protein TNCV_3946001 [Trichonephila clavipes]